MILYHFSRTQLVLMAVLVLAASALLLGSRAGNTEATQAPYYHRVKTYTVEQQPAYAIARRFSGTVSARQHADMGFELAGKLADVLVDQGNQVREGEVLATLDTELLRIEGRELDARLAETRARLTLTETSLRRQRSLRESGFASEQHLDELEAERAALLASIARQDASVASVASRIRKSTLRAPFDGVVTRRFADQGAVLNPGVAVLRLQQQGAMEVHIGVPVRLLGLLLPGDRRPIEVNGKTLPGQVLAVGADVHPVSRTVTVRFGLPPDALAVNGDLAYLSITEAVDTAGFWIPAEAVTDGIRGLWSVYAVVEPGAEVGPVGDTAAEGTPADLRQLETRDVQIAHATPDKVFVHGSLRDGEVIVAAGLHRLVPGQQVVVSSAATDSSLAGTR